MIIRPPSFKSLTDSEDGVSAVKLQRNQASSNEMAYHIVYYLSKFTA